MTCTCLPTCDDTCRGYCGCQECLESEDYHADEPGWLPIAATGETCEACGRTAGHLDDCVHVGGTRDLAARRKQRVKERVDWLKRELRRYEGEEPNERMLFEMGEA